MTATQTETPLHDLTPTRFLFQLTALSTIAHGEAGPATAGPRNSVLFNREITRLPKAVSGVSDADAMRALVHLFEVFEVGEGTLDFLGALSGPVLLSGFFVAQVPLLYGGGDGTGLFAGVERYEYLTTRLSDGAASASNLSQLWGYLARSLSLGMYPERAFERMKAFLSLPLAIQGQMLLGAYKETQTVVLAARDIADSVRAASPEYAEKKGKVSQKPVRYAPTPEQLHDLAIERKEAVALRIPKLSGNALRHCALRSPAAD